MRPILALACLLALVANGQAEWKPAGDRIKTDWGVNLDPENVWDAYPRPLLQRVTARS